jgi:hypothetical protein
VQGVSRVDSASGCIDAYSCPSSQNTANPNTCNEQNPSDGITPHDLGKETFFDGTLSTLVVTGKTVSGASFECRDITTTFAILDHSGTQAFLDPANHKVVIANQSLNGTPSLAPFTCTGIGTDTDPVDTIEVQFAKT